MGTFERVETNENIVRIECMKNVFSILKNEEMF